MCEHKQTKARKYRRKQLASDQIVISRRKSHIYSLPEPITFPMHLLKEMLFLRKLCKITFQRIYKNAARIRLFLTVGIPVTLLFISAVVVDYRVGCVRTSREQAHVI